MGFLDVFIGGVAGAGVGFLSGGPIGALAGAGAGVAGGIGRNRARGQAQDDAATSLQAQQDFVDKNSQAGRLTQSFGGRIITPPSAGVGLSRSFSRRRVPSGFGR